MRDRGLGGQKEHPRKTSLDIVLHRYTPLHTSHDPSLADTTRATHFGAADFPPHPPLLPTPCGWLWRWTCPQPVPPRTVPWEGTQPAAGQQTPQPIKNVLHVKKEPTQAFPIYRRVPRPGLTGTYCGLPGLHISSLFCLRAIKELRYLTQM